MPLEIVATVLVAQAYVYYFIVFQQFGFYLSGPARLGLQKDPATRYLTLLETVRFKLGVWILLVLSLAGLVIMLFPDFWYLAGFVLLLLGYALNANWYLQAEGDFHSAVSAALVGVFIGVLVLGAIGLGDSLTVNSSGWLGCCAVFALISPQVMVGVESFWVARRNSESFDISKLKRQWPKWEMWHHGWPLVLSQLLMLGSTTLGTLLVGVVATPEVTASYAATEKIFNLAATVFVALYTVQYPSLARCYSENKTRYWQAVRKSTLLIVALGVVVLLLMTPIGSCIFEFYLGPSLVQWVSPILVPMAVWLMLVPLQNALQCHLAIDNKTRWSMGLAVLMLIVELAVGWPLMMQNPVYWAYGMVAAQVPPAILLAYLYRLNTRLDGAS